MSNKKKSIKTSTSKKTQVSPKIDPQKVIKVSPRMVSDSSFLKNRDNLKSSKAKG